MSTSLAPTFLAALRAVGTAATMAFAGFYLHRRNFVTPSGKKMMALLSQQVTIPAFLFAKIIYCPSGGSGSSNIIQDLEPSIDGMPEIVCPSVASRLSDLWMLLLWPGYVVFCGLVTGYIAARVSKTPPLQINSCLAACAFGNSTGLVITLLSVIHKQFKKSSELGRIDPTAFLSVYLLLYPVLQWGVGGWLLAPEEKTEGGNMEKEISMVGKMEGGNINDLSIGNGAGQNSISEAKPLLAANDSENVNSWRANHHSLRISHILNREQALQSPSLLAGQEEFGGVRPRRFVLRSNENSNGQADSRRWYTAGDVDSSSNTLSMMVKELSFTNLGQLGSFEAIPSYLQAPLANGVSLPQPQSEIEGDDGPFMMDAAGDATSALDAVIADATPTIHENVPLINGHPTDAVKDGTNDYATLKRTPSLQEIQSMQEQDILPLTETLLRISRKVFQPPVIGALLGLFIASFPNLRGLMENIWGDETRTAPLKWLFDGIYSVGNAAVPINMTILGINLSSTFQKKKPKKNDNDNEKSKMLSNQTMLAVVVGKMVIMPLIGIVSTWFLQQYYNIPDEIDATCYLVMMIVFITPTANNVMVMVELSGSSSKEGMARLIGWQYAVSPVVLSIVLAVVVNLASCHFDT